MCLMSFDSGSTPSFFSNTIDSRAARRASASCCGDWFTEYGTPDHGTLLAGSNMPRRMRACIRRVSATSISLSLMRPSCTALTRAAYSVPQSRSTPFFTASALAASTVSTTLWCL